jgi:hypothetical protein
MQWSLRDSAPENLFAVLREIAAQLAEIKAEVGQIGPETAPNPKAAK